MVTTTDRRIRACRHPREQRGDHVPRRPRPADEAPRPHLRREHARAVDRHPGGRCPACSERGEGAILNVSSLAALNYFPGADGVRDVEDRARAHDRVGRDPAAPDGIAVNTFRIDVARRVARASSYNSPGVDHSRLGAARGRRRGHRLDAAPAARSTPATTWAWPSCATSTGSWRHRSPTRRQPGPDVVNRVNPMQLAP